MPIERIKPGFTFTEEQIQQLKQIVPECFADGKINWTTLKEALGNWEESEDADAEHFGLFWPGKREARRSAGTPSGGTLVPVPGKGVNEATTRNIFIEGENLEVLKLLQKSYAGRIKMIYIDPPYNTGNDFVYDDNFTETLDEYFTRTGQIDEEGRKLTTNTKADGRFHSRWLSMMYPRLRLARDLLREDGVIMISIDDNEVHHLRMLMNEVFGEENFVAEIVWQKSKKGDSKLIATIHEYILVACRNKDVQISENYWRIKKAGAEEVLSYYEDLRKTYRGNHQRIEAAIAEFYSSLDDDDDRKKHKHYKNSDDRGLYFPADFSGPNDGRKSRPRYDIFHPITGRPCKKPATGWRWDEKRTEKALSEKPALIHFGKDETTIPCRKSYLKDIDTEPFPSVFYRDGRGASLTLDNLVGKGTFSFPKDKDIIAQLVKLTTEPGDIILDFFAGSGTTGHSVFDLNSEEGTSRYFLLVQLAEQIDTSSAAASNGYKTIAQITIERLKKASKVIKKDVGSKSSADLGFRVYKLLNSNYKIWENVEDQDLTKLELQFEQFESPLVDDWKEEDLLTEVMLIEGFPLDSTVEEEKSYKKNKVQVVSSDFSEHRLVICLDKKVYADTVNALQLDEGDVFIGLDTAINDEQKATLSDKCLIKTI